MRPFIVPGVVFCAFEIGSISTRAMKICKLNSAPSSSGFKALKTSMDRTAFEGMPRLFETQEQRQPVMWPPAPLQVLDRLGQMLIDFQDHGVFCCRFRCPGTFHIISLLPLQACCSCVNGFPQRQCTQKLAGRAGEMGSGERSDHFSQKVRLRSQTPVPSRVSVCGLLHRC